MATSKIPQGIDGLPTTLIPDDPQAFVSWFKNYGLKRWFANGDIRNAITGPGITITGTSVTPATISVTGSVAALSAQPYLLVGSPVPPANLTDYRSIAAEAGVLTLTDAGAELALTIGVATNGIGAAQIRQSAALSVIGNATALTANVADIAATSAGQVLQYTGGVLNFGLPTTQPWYDNTQQIATDAFVQLTETLAMATAPLSSFTGGTYNFASAGINAILICTVSAGAITGINTYTVPGTGYAVGDVIQLALGNTDNYLSVTSVNGSGGITGITVLYGGTGCGAGPFSGAAAANSGIFAMYPYAWTLTGVLTSNATIIVPPGTFLANGNQWVINNNTTGAHTVTVKLGNGSGGSIGTGVVIPQGSNNSTATLIQTDGVNDVWSLDSVVSSDSLTGLGSAASPITLVSDVASPGDGRVYGTGSGGTRGWQPMGLTPNVITEDTMIPADYSYVVIEYLNVGANTLTLAGNLRIL